MKYICILCGYLYEDHDCEAPLTWALLPDDWRCPDCGADKTYFGKLDLESSEYDE